MYYQTTPLEDCELTEAKEKALKQEDEILQIMSSGKKFTAFEISNNYIRNVPITSIRRALFVLEKEGKIIQDGFVLGPYKRPIGIFKVKN